jgi:hypothetical protein
MISFRKSKTDSICSVCSKALRSEILRKWANTLWLEEICTALRGVYGIYEEPAF